MTNNTLWKYKSDKILIAAHRGTPGGNIPCNTIPAFDIALKQGAAILEMDVFKSVDDKLFIFHTGREKCQLNADLNITELTSEEIAKLRYVNSDFAYTTQGLNTLDEVLEHYKDKCIINLDRCWKLWPDVVKAVEMHNMCEQILLKSPPEMQYFKVLEEVAPSYMFMPIAKQTENCVEILEKMNINFIGLETVFSSEESPLAQDGFIKDMHKKGRILWGNAIVYDYKEQLSAGHNDDISVAGNPNDGWGWLKRKGFDIIQTDWTLMLNEYLNETHY